MLDHLQALDVKHSRVDEQGYVTCTLRPFDKWTRKGIGRITTWPKGLPFLKRNISCACFLHGGCNPPARNTRQVSQHELLVWLFSARLEPMPTKARLMELRAEHFADFQH